MSLFGSWRRRARRGFGFLDVVRDTSLWRALTRQSDDDKAAIRRARDWDDQTVAKNTRWYILNSANHPRQDVMRRMLGEQEERTWETVLQVLRDAVQKPEFTCEDSPQELFGKSPLERACYLLGDSPPLVAIPLLEPFQHHADEDVRREAAYILAKMGDAAAVPAFRRAMTDESPELGTHALIGLEFAITRQRISPETAQELFAILREAFPRCCAERHGSEAAERLLGLDQATAVEFLSALQFWSLEAPEFQNMVNALAEQRVRMDRDKLLEMIPQLSGRELDDFEGRNLGKLLHLLGIHRHPDDESLLIAMMSHSNEQAADGACSGVLEFLSRFDPRAAWRIGYPPTPLGEQQQRLVESIFYLDAEVRNGGWLQYYFNSRGGDWAQARESLRTIGAQEPAEILSRCIALFGKSGPAVDREQRQRQLGHLSETTLELIHELNEAWYLTTKHLRAQCLKYLLAVSS